MDRKERLRKRTMNFFIESAKEIVLDEGLDGLTSKKVANHANYASGTLYNYFESLDELLYHCALDFSEEPIKILEKSGYSTNNTEDQIIELFEIFTRYFLEHKNLIELVFYKNFGDIPKKIPRKSLINMKSFELLTKFGKENERQNSELILIGNILTKNVIGGIILFSYGSYAIQDVENFIKDQNESVKLLLNAETNNNDLNFYSSIFDDIISRTQENPV